MASPTVREICAAAGIKSTSTVHAYLKVLEEEGYINRQSGLNRAIRLPGESVARGSSVGQGDGRPADLSSGRSRGIRPLFRRRVSAGELFALRVSGTSMINAGILDHDVVIVKKKKRRWPKTVTSSSP